MICSFRVFVTHSPTRQFSLALITEPAMCAARVPAIAALLATAPAVAAADADIVAAEVAALKNLAPNSTHSSVDASISS